MDLEKGTRNSNLKIFFCACVKATKFNLIKHFHRCFHSAKSFAEIFLPKKFVRQEKFLLCGSAHNVCVILQ